MVDRDEPKTENKVESARIGEKIVAISFPKYSRKS